MSGSASGSVTVLLTHNAIGCDSVPGDFGAPEDGAVNVFLGVTRNHHDGRAVLGLEYHGYEDMAQSQLEHVANGVASEFGLTRLMVVHRLGKVGIGEVSLVVAAAAHHRQHVLNGTLAMIDRLKRDVPIWKREYFADGQVGWVEGANVVPSTSEANSGGKTGGVA
jgi:molybdopterin synthase catalytic subunit